MSARGNTSVQEGHAKGASSVQKRQCGRIECVFARRPSVTARWSSLTNNKGAGIFGRKEVEPLLRKLASSQKIYVRLTEYQGERHSATFDLRGINEAAEAVANACGWTTIVLTREDYVAIQQMLNAAGFQAGTPDGVWGKDSQNAMKQYQASVGLTQTGAPDRPTLENLGWKMPNPK